MAGINYQAMAPGMSRLALAIGGGGVGGRQRGYDEALMLESRIAQAAASTHAANEAARLRSLEADAEEEAKLRRAPDAILRTTLTQHSIPTEEAGAVSEYLKTGALGGKYAPGPGGMGPVAPEPDWMDRLGAVSRAVGTTQHALTVGDKSVENIAKASAIGLNEERKGRVLAGKLDPTLFAQSEYAGKGRAPYRFSEHGVGNNLTGQVNDQTGPAQRFAQYRNSTAAAQRANAVQSYASADASRASAAKTRADMSRDARGADIVQVQQPDGTLWLVNKVNGLSRQVMGPDGRPVMAKGTAHPGTAPEEDRTRLSGQLGVPVAPADPFRNMTVKGQEAMRKSVYEKADKRIAEMEEQARVEQSTAAQVKRFVDLQAQTGGMQQGVLMGRLPGVTDAAQEMDAITDFLTPKMREPGSGATSDFDAKMFRNATVGRTKSDEVNAAIAEGVQARARMAADRAQFMRDYLTVNGHLDGAERTWAQYAAENPIFDPRSPQQPVINRARMPYQQYFGGNAPQPDRSQPGTAGGPRPGTVEGGYRFKGGNPADRANWERVQ